MTIKFCGKPTRDQGYYDGFVGNRQRYQDLTRYQEYIIGYRAGEEAWLISLQQKKSRE